MWANMWNQALDQSRLIGKVVFFTAIMERFSIEYRDLISKIKIKTKTYIHSDQSLQGRTEPIKTSSKYMQYARRVGKRACMCERVTIDFGFTSDWMPKWRKFFKPIVYCVVLQNQSKCKLIPTLNGKSLKSVAKLN